MEEANLEIAQVINNSHSLLTSKFSFLFTHLEPVYFSIFHGKTFETGSTGVKSPKEVKSQSSHVTQIFWKVIL